LVVAGLLFATSLLSLPTAQNAASGPSVLRGRVLAADDRAAVKGAYVRVRALGQIVVTGNDGAFRFEGLSGPVVMVQIEAPSGFATSPSEALVVLSSDATHERDFLLERTGAVTGRVVDETGSPVAGVPLQLIRRYGGTLRASNVRGRTDDRGQFRMFNLEPGDYFLIATPSRYTHYPEVVRRSGYADTYYPNVPTIEHARPISVRPREDGPRLTLALLSAPLYRVTVNAVDATGAPVVPRTTPALKRLGHVDLDSTVRTIDSGGKSQFVFADVPPGDYDVFVDAKYRQERGYSRVKVADADLSVTVRTNAGARISGRIAFRGSLPPADGSTSSVYVMARRPYGTFGLSYMEESQTSTRATALGPFELKGVRGPVVLDANTRPGAALVSIRRGDLDITEQTMTFDGTEVIEDVEITFTTDVARVEVDVAGTSPPEAPEHVLVVLFHDDPSAGRRRLARYGDYWISRAGPFRWRPTEPVNAGITFGDLLPGPYRVAAVRAHRLLDPAAPAFLEKLRPLATPVTLVSGQPSRVSIPIMDVPQ
jgi:hypothetical protein